jgi:HEAT repeat protein
MEQLQSPQWQLRWKAAESLGKMRHQEALEPLIELLEDPQEEVRATVSQALGLLGRAEAVEPILNRLRKEARLSVVRHIVLALGRIGDERALKPILTMVGNDKVDWNLRCDGLRALGHLEDSRAVPTLAKFMDHSNKYMREAAFHALEEINSPAAKVAIDEWRYRRQRQKAQTPAPTTAKK